MHSELCFARCVGLAHLHRLLHLASSSSHPTIFISATCADCNSMRLCLAQGAYVRVSGGAGVPILHWGIHCERIAAV